MEIAGIVLGAIPICVLALEGWEATEPRVRAFWKAPITISRYVRDLRGHRDNLEVIIKTMLYGCLPLAQIENNFEEVLMKDWSEPSQIQLVVKLRAKHGDSYRLFQTGIQDICEDIKALVRLLGLWTSAEHATNAQLDALLQSYSRSGQAVHGVRHRFHFALRHSAIRNSLSSLSSSIDSTCNRLKTNEAWQKRRRVELRSKDFAAVQRRRDHVQALASTIAQASVTDFLVILDTEDSSERSTEQGSRFQTAFLNQACWTKAIFHLSERDTAHSFHVQPSGTATIITDLRSFIETAASQQRCMELHLDLGAQHHLTGPYITPHGARLPITRSDAQLMSVRSMLGKPVSRRRRLKTATILTSWFQLLYRTPFLPGAPAVQAIHYFGADPINNLTDDDHLCLRTGALSSMATLSATERGSTLLMLGILLIELYTNKACTAIQVRMQLSLQDLGNVLNDLMASESHDLPMPYSKAISDCWRLAHAPHAFDTDFGELVELVSQTAARL